MKNINQKLIIGTASFKAIKRMLLFIEIVYINKEENISSVRRK